MKDFVWEERKDDWLLFHKGYSYYLGVIHKRFSNGNYYVDVFIYNTNLRIEFLEKNLEIAKLKAVIKAAEFLSKDKNNVGNKF